jgi:trigger factor
MKFDVKKLPKSLVEIKVTEIDKELLEKYEKQSVKELSEKLDLKGFRKGNIPEDVARKNIGEDQLELQIIHNVLPEIWIEAVKESKIIPIGEPKIQIDSAKPLELTWTVPTRPDIKVGDYKKINIPKKEVKITKDDVDKVLEDIKMKFKTEKEVEREIKEGDKTEIDFEGKTPDGVVLDNTTSKNHPVIVGENVLMPDFEKELVGLKKGQEKEFEITFPDDYHTKNMAGKKVVFHVKINKVLELTPPEIDKELSQKVFGKELEKDEFIKELEETLKKQAEEQEKRQMENAYFAEFIKLVDVELPELVIKEEQEHMVNETKQRILYQGLSFDEYLKHIKKTEEEFKESLQKEAEERIKLQLGISEVKKLENIDVEDKEVEEEINKILERYDKKEQDEARKKFAKGTQGFASVKHKLAMQKTLNTILPH